MPELTQRNRQLRIDTPLGEDVLLLQSFFGQEEVSRLYSFQLEMFSERDDIKAADIVGKNVTVTLAKLDESPRHFNGYISEFAYLGTDGRGSHYHAVIVPWLWFLTKRADCRIFQEMTIPQIVEEVFSGLGFSDFEIRASGTHSAWEYCVQYRETDFNFVSRLLEQEGLFYYFLHEDGKHTLVIGDKNTAFEACPESEVAAPGDLSAPGPDDGLLSWHHNYRFQPGKYTQTDYNFKTPKASLETTESTVVPYGESKYEIYDYPGEYPSSGDGQHVTRYRMEEQEVVHDVVTGTSIYRSFTAGAKIKIVRHMSREEVDKEYVLTSVSHRADLGDSYTSGGAAAVEYSNDFRCLPFGVAYRPLRTTPKPIVQGVQTAVVTGPSGEEIYTDEFGRVKVQFHWDRLGKKDESSSCWIRVSSTWAGKGWGQISIPRIDQEVIVDFLEGDPDRPIITGRVYNADQTVPYPLPAEATKSTIKTRSSKGGGAANFNEIRFEDKKGSEELYFHAEKDQNEVVENDQTIQVGHDRSETIGRDRTLDVGRDKTETVGRNKSVTVAAEHTETIGGNMAVSVGSNLSETVALNYAETVGAAMELTVGAAMTLSIGAVFAETVGGMKSETIGAGKTLTIGKDFNESIGKERSITVAKDQTEKIGGKCEQEVAKEFKLSAKKIQLVANDEITFKTGSAQIVLKKNGDIEIKGKKINVKGSGDVIIKGSQIKEN